MTIGCRRPGCRRDAAAPRPHGILQELAAMSRRPTTPLDSVRQLRVLAGVLPGVAWSNGCWTPRSSGLVVAGRPGAQRPRLRPDGGLAAGPVRAGAPLTVVTRLPLLPLSLRFQVELCQGWCLVRSRAYLVGMAAVSQGAQTRYAH